jgi:tetratricopeptide (TPR) repeat protein
MSGTLFFGILFLLLSANSVIVAQNKEQKRIDSLKAKTLSKVNDTNKIKALYTLADKLSDDEKEQALGYGEEAVKLARQLNWGKGEAYALKNIGTIYTKSADYSEAMEYQEKAMKIFEQLHDKTGIGRCLNSIGFMYLRLYDYPKALEYFEKAVKKAEETGDKYGMSRSLDNLGIVYRALSNYPKAIESNEKSLRFSQEIGDKSIINSNLNELGISYFDLSDYPIAMEYFEKSLNLSEELGNRRGTALTLLNIGNIYFRLHDYTKALEYYEKSLKIKEELNLRADMSGDLSNMGRCYLEQHDFTKALEYFKNSMKIEEEYAHKDGIAMNMTSIAKVYYVRSDYPKALEYSEKALKISEELGNKINIVDAMSTISAIYWKMADYHKSLEYANKALGVARETGTLMPQLEVLENLLDAYEKIGPTEKKFEYYKMYITCRDSIVNENNAKKIVELQMQYEFDKKESLAKAGQEKKDAIALKELQKQKLLKYSFLGGIVLVLLLFFFIYRNYHVRQELRLHEIRNKIAGDLHDDIGSTLNSISIYSEVARKKDGSAITDFQIHGRTKNYPQYFNREGSMVSLKSNQLSDRQDEKVHVAEIIKPDLPSQKALKSPSLEKTLMDPKNFKNACAIDRIVPDVPGLYCIRVKSAKVLPNQFQKAIAERKHDIIYIGVASESLYRRFLNQELRANGHGTFFRSIGAVLGYRPPKGSLKNKANKRNYKFSSTDETKIISWMNTNLIVNWIEYNGNIDSLETLLIQKYRPLLNIAKNPSALKILSDLRAECVRIANE